MSDLRVFDAGQAAVLTAIAEHIFPADAESPGATDAGVVGYIDGQLAGAWGAGRGLYRSGPFVVPDHAGHGPQSPLTPVETYAHGLRALAVHTEREYGRRFDALTGEEREAVFVALTQNAVDTFDALLPASQFFALVRANVLEGLFADPHHGGNRDLIGWRWLGFPGAPADDYAEHIDRPGEAYAPAPQALRDG
jgi:gluconate 2-dehydrogenase gamma chain